MISEPEIRPFDNEIIRMHLMTADMYRIICIQNQNTQNISVIRSFAAYKRRLQSDC